MARPREHYPTQRLRAARQTLVARYYLQGLTFQEIADKLHAEPGMERTAKSTVHHDVKALLAEWRRERLDNIEDYVAVELRRIGDATAALWAEWEKSKGGGDRPAAVGYITEIRMQLAERRKLLGLYAPERREVSGPGGGPVPLAGLTTEEIEDEIKRLAEGMPAGGEGELPL